LLQAWRPADVSAGQADRWLDEGQQMKRIGNLWEQIVMACQRSFIAANNPGYITQYSATK
jgi:hypothetical protein